MDEYQRNLDTAFLQKRGNITNGTIQINENFNNWVYGLQEYQIVYAKFLAGLVLTEQEKKGIIELNKGIIDSILGGLEAVKIEKAIAITPYSYTFRENYLKIRGYKDDYLLNRSQPFINCNLEEFLNIEKVMNDKTVFPTLAYQLTPNAGWPGIYNLKDIIDNYNKTVVIGAYGSKNDKDIELRHQTIKDIYEEAIEHGMEARIYSSDNYPFFHTDYELANDLEGFSYNEAVKVLSKTKNN